MTAKANNARPIVGWEKVGATAPPPPLWGRDRVRGIAEHRGVGFPPPLAPPHKGEGNPRIPCFKRIPFIRASALHLDLHEGELEVVGVDHVVMHTGLAEVGYTQLQI